MQTTPINTMINPYVYAGLPMAQKKNLTPEQKANVIIEQICEHYQCTWQYITKHTRVFDVIRKRQVAMYILARHSGLPLVSIARLFPDDNGRRKDHSTIIHNRNKIAREINVYDDVTSAVNGIEMRLKMVL